MCRSATVAQGLFYKEKEHDRGISRYALAGMALCMSTCEHDARPGVYDACGFYESLMHKSNPKNVRCFGRGKHVQRQPTETANLKMNALTCIQVHAHANEGPWCDAQWQCATAATGTSDQTLPKLVLLLSGTVSNR